MRSTILTALLISPVVLSAHADDKRDQLPKDSPAPLTAPFDAGQAKAAQDEWAPLKDSYIKEGADYPATYVTYDDAIAYCRKLTEAERKAGRLPVGSEYSLPTEAQWEYAARAGTTSNFSFGDDESLLKEYAWWGGVWGDGNAKHEQYAHQVGQKKPNAWRLHDMHGNVWEWCKDEYEMKLVGGTDPEVTSNSSDRVIRGGSWSTVASFCRSAFRHGVKTDYSDRYLGFRVARSSGQTVE